MGKEKPVWRLAFFSRLEERKGIKLFVDAVGSLNVTSDRFEVRDRAAPHPLRQLCRWMSTQRSWPAVQRQASCAEGRALPALLVGPAACCTAQGGQHSLYSGATHAPPVVPLCCACRSLIVPLFFFRAAHTCCVLSTTRAGLQGEEV